MQHGVNLTSVSGWGVTSLTLIKRPALVATKLCYDRLQQYMSWTLPPFNFGKFIQKF